MDSLDQNARFFGPLAPSQLPPASDMSGDNLGVGTDGTVDRLIKKRDSVGDQRPSMAVFIHAGAGYHSLQNESVHLTLCAKAAQEAMKCLKNGGSATDAVEAAIVVLENGDITNAGYGSNLSVNGTVECDATIVDHFGRSGACGAVPNIKNPISLAKVILNASLTPLTLRRVPPNILVGEGAKRFAVEHGMSLANNKELISKNAVDRFRKWCEDLRKAQARVSQQQQATQVPDQATSPEEAKYSAVRMPIAEQSPQPEVLSGLQSLASAKDGKGLTMRDHSSAVLTGMWNEGQPDSPSDSASPGAPKSDPVTPTKPSPLSALRNGSQTPTRPGRAVDATRPVAASDGSVKLSRAKRLKTSSNEHINTANGVSELSDDSWEWIDHTLAEKLFSQPSINRDHEDAEDLKKLFSQPSINRDHEDAEDLKKLFNQPSINNDHEDAEDLKKLFSQPSSKIDLTEMTAEPDSADNDKITDTIGAIAIDGQGNMAAGSSSGGIGMKHMGRVGPAALVGIGTYVIPRDPEDEEARSVAAVTSGTGEHMATTMAAHKCADRLYHMTRAGRGGDDTLDVPDEGTVMADFVTRDFMGHPGVRNQTSAGAIGVLAVKATSSGIYMHWAHNTDSFALAHMASYHKEPKCVMSRLSRGKVPVNIGALKVLKDHAAGLKARD